MDERVAVGLAAALVGVLIGPYLAYVSQRWIGWRVVLPLFLGHVPPRSALRSGPGSARSRERCQGQNEYRRSLTVVTGVVFAIVGVRIGWEWSLAPVLVLCCGLIAASAVDLVCWRIPTRFVYWTMLGVAIALVVAAVGMSEPRSLWGALIGLAVYGGLLGGMHLLSPRMMGFGDVRLGALIGLVSGWVGWTTDHPVAGPISLAMFGVFVGSLVGSFAGIVFLVLRRIGGRLTRGWGEAFPFGPWLAIGSLAVILLAV